MLPFLHKILFLLFAVLTGTVGLRGFYRLYRRVARGRPDTDTRFDRLPRRIWYAIVTTLTQSRTFRKRPAISFFHSFIFYGFSFYLLVNLVDAIDGFMPLSSASLGVAGNFYVLLADVVGALVLVGVIALVIRRFLLPSRRDFTFNGRTILHKDINRQYITLDSVVVSAFILFHVGSRAIGVGAKIAAEGPEQFAPFATLLSHLFTPGNALAWRIFGYWGALGSVLAFLVYFPYSKHIHIFMAPGKYLITRSVSSGVLPAMDLDMDAESPVLGAKNLEDLAWPRLFDAYACIQCNRCQDVCPATATGKSLSPSALEINKRMELNDISKRLPSFESGAPSPLLTFALSPEAAWACTTCGACIEICPVGDEPMLDIIDIRRNQVMIEGEFPSQLQTAFRGMERAKNPWGISHDKRMDWADGLNVRTTDQNPTPDVLYWVGCAASYDPQSQKTARAFVQLLDHAGVDYAVLGKRECCTGDTARRSGNEYLYRQLADENVATLNEVRPKLVVATCPHCMNTVGKEYKQLGGDFKVIHHTEYLESLVRDGRLAADSGPSAVTYHDPCYLGRHNGVYDAPRNLLNILSNSAVELPRNRENSFCCGAGGAQFWKEEEEGSERISDNRYREVEKTLNGTGGKVLAVGCPFCKSMFESTPGKGPEPIAVRDIAELLLEGVQRRRGIFPKLLGTSESDAQATPTTERLPQPQPLDLRPTFQDSLSPVPVESANSANISDVEEKSNHEPWVPAAASTATRIVIDAITTTTNDDSAPQKRKTWAPAKTTPPEAISVEPVISLSSEPVKRKAWSPKSSTPSSSALDPVENSGNTSTE
jgi:Fe-S oxidoreductase/nitrate reductase gamma subunit